MCGRFGLAASPEEIQERFSLDTAPDWQPRYNLAPTEPSLVVTSAEPNRAQAMRWGLLPHWVKDAGSKQHPTFNARIETVFEKPTFREAAQRRHCLALTDGYYEWVKEGTAKTPHRIELTDGGLFAFAGLWEWNEHLRLHSYTVITMDAPKHMAHLHHRVPVILDREQESAWLDTALSSKEKVRMLRPPAEGLLSWRAVSAALNRAGAEGPELLRPPAGRQTSLFG